MRRLQSLPVAALLLLFGHGTSYGHEPIFGLGPRTIWKNGIGVEVEIEREDHSPERAWRVKQEFLYGLTENIALTVETRPFLERTKGEVSRTGRGDTLVRVKWRFYRKDVPGGVRHAALLGGLAFPTGDSRGTPALGSGSYDYLLGAAFGYEGRTWLGFAATRYRINTTNHGGVKNGNVLLYDLAVGWRPVKTEYLRPDWVLMLELDGQLFSAREVGGVEMSGSGGSRLFGAAGLWLTYRNWAFKPGIQLPLYHNLGGTGPKENYTAVAAIEVHF